MMKRTNGWSIAAVVLLLVGWASVEFGCASKQANTPEADDVPEKTPSLVNIQPRDGVYLRAGFDKDPSHFVGRFLNNDVKPEQIDETKGVQTRCSKHLEIKEVEAGGSFDEYFNASRSAGGSVSVEPGAFPDDVMEGNKPQAKAAAKLEKGTVVRIKYDLNKKMRGVKTDKYYKCCRKHVDACSGRYFSEFWKGTGEVYQAVGTKQSASASAQANSKGSASLEYKNGVAWKRSMTFEDMYFAFRTSRAKIESSGCKWADQPPTSETGKYFVGVSPPAATESKARTLAMRNARKQVVKYLGEYVSATSKTTSSAMKGYLKDEEVVQTAADGIAEQVKDKRWCPAETKESPDGTLYKVKVLSFFPDEAKKEAAKAVIDNIKASKKVEPEDVEQLDEAKKAIDADTASK
ncbi:MAG: hypothetical protein ABEK29_00630 [Bradymonadaceae bacterium]